MKVVDASVSIKWVYDEAGAADAHGLLRTEPQLAAPAIWRLETANALARRGRDGLLAPAEVRERLAYLHDLPIVLVDDASLLAPALEISLELRHPLYDCLYLALAVRERSLLFTADGKFAKIATRGGHGDRLQLIGSDQP